jgi:O-acetyl-ADP-ribose deacetylase (regulator of RNase III)
MIHMRGGGAIQKELNAMAPVAPLDVVVSSGGRLKAEHILHAVGPRFREDDIEQKLLLTMEKCLELAKEKRMKTLAFPAMGAGYYGIPAGVSAKVMLDALGGFLTQNSGLEEVTICVLDKPQFQAFEAAMAAASNGA